MHVESNFPEAGTRSQSGEVGTGGKDGARGISNSGKTQVVFYCFWFLIWAGRGSSKDLHSAVPTIIATAGDIASKCI